MEGVNPNTGMNLDIEAMIPHRDRMRLIDAVIAVDDLRAVTAATATEDWPLYRDGFVDALVTIELVAQTAALLEGWKRLRTGRGSATGWLVGIKSADFRRSRLPVRATWSPKRRRVTPWRATPSLAGRSGWGRRSWQRSASRPSVRKRVADMAPEGCP